VASGNFGTPDFIVYSDGTLADAGGGEYANASASAALDRAINQLGGAARGSTIALHGSMSWNSVPSIPPNTSSKLRIVGTGSTVVTLTTAGPRFVDFNKTADHDTFQNIEIADLKIDCNNVGGQHHIVIGTYISGATQGRINLKSIAVRRVTVVNVPTDPAIVNHRLGVWLVVNHPTANEATQDVVRDITVEDYYQYGGNAAIGVAANGGGAGRSANVFVDNWLIRRWYHDLLQVPTAFFASSHVQVVGSGIGGDGQIRDGQGFNSGDVGIEDDGSTSNICENVSVTDAFNFCFYHINFNNALYQNQQRIVWNHCNARKINVTGARCQGFYFGGTVAANPCQTHELNGCTWYNTSATAQAGDALYTSTTNAVKRLIVRDFRAHIQGFDMTTNSTNWISAFLINAASTGAYTCNVFLRDIEIYMDGTRHAGSSSTLFQYGLSFGGNGTMVLDADNILIDHSQANAVGTSIQLVAIPHADAYTLNVKGRIARVYLVRTAGDTGSIGLRLNSNVTIDRSLICEAWEFKNAPASHAEFSFQTPTTQRPLTFLQNIRWRVFPPASAAMGATNFAAATFTTATGNQYIGGAPADIHFATGTGAAITAIDVSKDGATYENAYTQASGAMANSVLVPVDNGDYLKVTFATTQPTTRVRFKK
jgi:hypothetical protein